MILEATNIPKPMVLQWNQCFSKFANMLKQICKKGFAKVIVDADVTAVPLGCIRWFNARRWLTPVTLGETNNVLAKRARNLNPVQITADVAIIYNSGVGALSAFGKVAHVPLKWRVPSTRISSGWLQVLSAASGAERNNVDKQKSKWIRNDTQSDQHWAKKVPHATKMESKGCQHELYGYQDTKTNRCLKNVSK